MRYVLFAALIFLAGYALSENPTLLVENLSINNLVIYANGSRVGSVQAGTKECIKLPLVTKTRLSVRAIGERAEYVSPEENFQNHEGWLWRLDNTLQLSSQNIRPWERCT